MAEDICSPPRFVIRTVPEQIETEWAIAHLRGVILHLGTSSLRRADHTSATSRAVSGLLLLRHLGKRKEK